MWQMLCSADIHPLHCRTQARGAVQREERPLSLSLIHISDVHALTALILSESRSRRGLEDDCAVLAVHLPLPGENRPRQV